jgi:hypothetical protein
LFDELTEEETGTVFCRSPFTLTETYTFSFVVFNAQCADLQPELDHVTAEIARRDCQGSREIAVQRLESVREAMKAARAKRNFRKVRSHC